MGRRPIVSVEHLPGNGAPGSEAAKLLPEAPEGRYRPACRFQLSHVERPVDRRAQVIVVEIETIEPEALVSANKLRLGALSEIAKVAACRWRSSCSRAASSSVERAYSRNVS